MAKLTEAQIAQHKLTIRNYVKSTFNLGVCLLNKDFREKTADALIESAKQESLSNSKDIKLIQLYPKFTIIRRAINNILDTVELNNCIEISHLRADNLKQQMQVSIDLALEASAWNLEDFNNIVNIDSTAMPLSSKIAHVLANPKENSLVKEGLSLLAEYAQPLVETYTRINETYVDIAQKAYEEAKNTPEDALYTTINGKVILKSKVKEYESFQANLSQEDESQIIE